MEVIKGEKNLRRGLAINEEGNQKKVTHGRMGKEEKSATEWKAKGKNVRTRRKRGRERETGREDPSGCETSPQSQPV